MAQLKDTIVYYMAIFQTADTSLIFVIFFGDYRIGCSDTIGAHDSCDEYLVRCIKGIVPPFPLVI